MASRTVVEIYDDIDGTPLGGEGETISFALDGVEYTIDLNKKNARDFRKKIEHYVAHATRVGGRKRRASTASAATPGMPSTKEIRDWALQAGYDVPARGRLPQLLIDEYTAAH